MRGSGLGCGLCAGVFAYEKRDVYCGQEAANPGRGNLSRDSEAPDVKAWKCQNTGHKTQLIYLNGKRHAILALGNQTNPEMPCSGNTDVPGPRWAGLGILGEAHSTPPGTGSEGRR